LHDFGIPSWVAVAIAVTAIIPMLYLLMRDTKAKVFLKPTDFQDLPLDHIEVSIGNLQFPVTALRSKAAGLFACEPA
jgi:hypothetical protein